MVKTRILQVVGGMNRGGAETFLMNVLRNINKQDFEILFLCYGPQEFDYEDELNRLGARIIRTPDVKDVGIAKHIKNIQRILNDERIDIIHTHTFYNSMFSLIAAKNAGVKTRITHSHTTKSEHNPNIAKRIYFAISKYIVNRYSTDFVACGEEAGEALFFRKNVFKVIDNGIILDDFYFNASTRQKLRSELGLSEQSTVLGHVGRIDVQKNQLFLVDIFSEYVKNNSDSYLMLVGEGVLKEKLIERIDELGISENVIMMGKRSDVSELYNVMDVFVFPSIREGLPVVLVEAQANGLPCIISDSIDKASKLTDCVQFLSLSEPKGVWARAIGESDLKRKNTRQVLQNSSYNMKNNITKIEDLYKKKENL